MSGERILVIDDERVVRDNLIAFLEDEGYHPYGAESAERAIAMMDSESFSLSIVDMRLPGMDGNSFIHAAALKQPGMKYIIHTGSSTYNLPKSLEELGLDATQIFRKPVADMGLLVDAIKRLTGTR